MSDLRIGAIGAFIVMLIIPISMFMQLIFGGEKIGYSDAVIAFWLVLFSFFGAIALFGRKNPQ